MSLSPPSPPPALGPGSAVPERMRLLRWLVVYPAHSAARMAHEEAAVARARTYGFDVRAQGVPCPDGWWDFARLDEAWRRQDPALMRPYEGLAEALADADVVVASGGSMLHPGLLRCFDAYSVFVCGDDPENSERLSKPVAPSFDHCLPTNIACVDDYLSWGCARVDWIFPPLRPDPVRDRIGVEDVLEGCRGTAIAMLSERIHGLSDRAQRLERLHREFPEAVLRGPGWPLGFLPAHEVGPLLADTRIGWNLHNSIGPCNTRLMELPAWGVLQICDNAERLGRIFALGHEVVGFTSIDDCVDRTRYYLAHDRERRELAARGLGRVRRDYTEERWWERLAATIASPCLETLARRRGGGGR